MRVLVVGAGIAGLAAAVGLRRAGHEVTVLERAAGLRTGGGAINVQGGGVRVLTGLGLDVARFSHRVRTLEARSAAGRSLTRINADRLAGGSPVVMIARGRLIEELAALLPDRTIQCGTSFKTLHSTGEDGRVEAETGDGALIAADLLVGADGAHSKVRTALFGPDSRPRATVASYQGLAPLPLDLGDRGLIIFGRHGIAGLTPAGGGLTQWFFDVPWSEEDRPDGEPLARIRQGYGDWADPIPAVLDALADVPLRPYPHYRLRAGHRWGGGRCVLLGDAAHAMSPVLGFGANQGLDDVAELLRHLPAPELEATLPLHRYRRARAWRAAAAAGLGGISLAMSGPRTLAQTEPALRVVSLVPNPLATWAYGRLTTAISHA